MQLVRGSHNLRPAHRGCVATIGNFDGVHLGHQAVFTALKARAQAMGLPSLVITFEPQPLEYFRPAEAPARLTRLREKLAAIAECGIDRVLLLEFGAHLASQSAEVFIQSLLLDKLDVRHLYVGDDFRFGKGRQGDFELLRRTGQANGFGVESLHSVIHLDERVSSTGIRQALGAGDLARAAHWLGRPYAICGRVGHGDERGRTIGFPTMNIDLHRQVSPLRGVFAVRVRGIDQAPLPGVANIGNRPTVAGDDRFLLEVHLFDFDREVYGEHVAVEFVERIRDEKRFDSFDQLKKQIQADAGRAREILGASIAASRAG